MHIQVAIKLHTVRVSIHGQTFLTTEYYGMMHRKDASRRRRTDRPQVLLASFISLPGTVEMSEDREDGCGLTSGSLMTMAPNNPF